MHLTGSQERIRLSAMPPVKNTPGKRTALPVRRHMGVGERRLSRLLLFLEDLVKVPIFRCQRCGECILSSTAFICSQNCPKRLRNGPCGGTGEDGSCEVFPDRKCVWYRIYLRSQRLHRLSLLYRTIGTHDWRLEGTSAWLNVVRRRTRGPSLRVHNDTQRIKDILADVAAGKD